MDKANAIMTEVADNCAEYLAWGESLAKEQRASSQSTLQHQLAVLGYVLQNMERYQQKELFNHYYDIYIQYAAMR